MAATMTDIQQAIDQLAVTRTNGDNTSHRTFSFTSGTDTDRESADDREDGRAGPEGWRGASRQLLAENAQKANLQQASAETESKERIAPPIPVEMSDESDADDDDALSPVHSPPTTARGVNFPVMEEPNPKRLSEAPSVYSPLQEELTLEDLQPETVAQPDVVNAAPPTPLRSPVRLAQSRELPDADGSIPKPDSPLQTSLDSPTTPVIPGAFAGEDDPVPANVEATPVAPAVVAAVVEPSSAEEPVVVQPPEPVPQATQVVLPAGPPPADIAKASLGMSTLTTALAQPLPQSAPITPPLTSFVTPSYIDQQSSVNSASPTLNSPFSASMPPSSAVASTFNTAATPISRPMSKAPSVQSSLETPGSQNSPSDWTVDQVVEWLRSKHFDEAICAKFIGMFSNSHSLPLVNGPDTPFQNTKSPEMCCWNLISIYSRNSKYPLLGSECESLTRSANSSVLHPSRPSPPTRHPPTLVASPLLLHSRITSEVRWGTRMSVVI